MPKPCALVIRQNDRFSDLLREGGLEVLNLELIRTEPLADLSQLDLRLARINEYDGLFFTSPISASVFVERSEGKTLGFSGKVYVLGERARRILEIAGFDVVSVPSANTAKELIGSIDESEFAGKRFLFIRGERSMRAIPELLGDRSSIDEVVVYRTIDRCPDESLSRSVRDKMASGEVDWICFFSPSGVESFLKLFSPEAPLPQIAVIGDTTAGRAAEAGLDVQYVSPRTNAEDFATGLIERCREA